MTEISKVQFTQAAQWVWGMQEDWKSLTALESRAVKHTKEILGEEAFNRDGTAYLEVSQKAHATVDELESRQHALQNGAKEEQIKFVEDYMRDMPDSLRNLCDVTLALARALRDYSSMIGDLENYNVGRDIVLELEKFDPDLAAAYNQEHPPAPTPDASVPSEALSPRNSGPSGP